RTARDKPQSVRLHGNVGDLGYYYVDALVGSPQPQRTSLVVDTGSVLCVMSCSECSHCGPHLDDPFDAGRSQTLSWVACGPHQTCGQCVDGRCGYHEDPGTRTRRGAP
ncbi:unnamed protein product, partial [Prorocentrum cordatum]